MNSGGYPKELKEILGTNVEIESHAVFKFNVKDFLLTIKFSNEMHRIAPKKIT